MELGVRCINRTYNHFSFVSMLSVTTQVHEFMAMPLDAKVCLKWKLFLERCAARILVLRSSSDRPRPLISLLSCNVADPSEAASCIPVYWFLFLCSLWLFCFILSYRLALQNFIYKKWETHFKLKIVFKKWIQNRCLISVPPKKRSIWGCRYRENNCLNCVSYLFNS